MEKSVAINGKVASKSGIRAQASGKYAESTRDHLKVWREIYQDVRRQWAEAEHGRAGRYGQGR